MKEFSDNPSRLRDDVAERYAEVVTFQNPNIAASTYDGIRRALIDDKKLAKFVPNEAQRKIAKYLGQAAYIASGQYAPFLHTPTNIGARTIEYTPVGFAIAGFNFYRIGRTLERQSWMSDAAAYRARYVSKLAGLRAAENKAFIEKTQEILNNTPEGKKAETRESRKTLQESQENRRKFNDKQIREEWATKDMYADIKFTEFENKRAVETAGRATFGSVLGGAVLFGVIQGILEAVGTTDYDEEKDKYYKKSAAGIADNSIKIGESRYNFQNVPIGRAVGLMLGVLEQSQRKGDTLDKGKAIARQLGRDTRALNPVTTGNFTKEDIAS